MHETIERLPFWGMIIKEFYILGVEIGINRINH